MIRDGNNLIRGLREIDLEALIRLVGEAEAGGDFRLGSVSAELPDFPGYDDMRSYLDGVQTFGGPIIVFAGYRRM